MKLPNAYACSGTTEALNQVNFVNTILYVVKIKLVN